jgi:hypothetical protein
VVKDGATIVLPNIDEVYSALKFYADIRPFQNKYLH